MKIRIIWPLLGLWLMSCAIPEPPPGGPEDKTPPEVVDTRPHDGESGVSVSTRIEIAFSEKMNTARFERLVELSPQATVSKTRWKKNTVTIEFASPLRPDTTYLVTVKPGAPDSHNVRSDKPFEFAFATSAEIDTGSIAGTIYFRRKPTEKAVVRLFVLPKDSSFTPEAARPDREVTTNKEGVYNFKYLSARGESYLIWAFEDADGNAVFDPEGEVGAALRDTLVLTQRRPRVELQDIHIVDPKEPASITGTVVNATPYDSIPVSVTLHEVADTLPPTYYTRADPKGRYSFQKVLKGRYTLCAFIDLKRDSLCGSYPCPEDSTRACPEFCVDYPETLSVSPGDQIQLKTIRLEGPRGKKE